MLQASRSIAFFSKLVTWDANFRVRREATWYRKRSLQPIGVVFGLACLSIVQSAHMSLEMPAIITNAQLRAGQAMAGQVAELGRNGEEEELETTARSELASQATPAPPAPDEARTRTSRSFRILRNLAYAGEADEARMADLYLPAGEGPFPTVMLVHGGAWVAGQKDHSAWHARRLAMRGFAAVAINYRLAPLHKFPAQLDDCRTALEWIGQVAEQYRVDRDRLAAYGYSAGGHLVCLLAMRQDREAVAAFGQVATGVKARTPRLKAVVAGGPPCEFRDVDPMSEKYVFWLGDTRAKRPQLYEQASPTHYVTDRAPPVFLFHGARDRVVDQRDSRLLHKQLKSHGVPAELYLVPNAGHFRAFMDRRAFEHSVRFLEEHLKADRSTADSASSPVADELPPEEPS